MMDAELTPLENVDRLLAEAKGASQAIYDFNTGLAKLWLLRIQAEAAEEQALAAERQAAAQETIGARLENVEKWLYNLHSQEWDSRAALERIAAVLERADNLSKMFGGEA